MDIDSVLHQMRQEHTPTQEDRARVRAALSTALIVSGTAGAAHVATTAGLKGAVAKGGAFALPVWIKGAIGVGAVVAAVGGGAYGVNAYRTASVPAPIAPTSPPPTVSGSLTSAASASALPVVEGPPVLLREEAPRHEPLGGATALPKAESTRTSRNAVAPASAGASLTSLGELRLISEASRAIREGRTDEARSALLEHEKRYTNTALGQERSGLDLLARCAESKGAATRQAAEAFLRHSPKSPLAGSIRRECLE